MFSIEKEVYSTLDFSNRLLEEVYSKYNRPTIVNIKYTRARSYWAKICKRGTGMYELILSNVFEDIPNENIARDRFTSSIIHELIHTIPGCWDHKCKFQLLCSLVNTKYPQYNLQTSTSTEDVGLVIEEKTPRYTVVCKHCGKEYKYWRKPRYSLDSYSCGNCKHNDLELRTNF